MADVDIDTEKSNSGSNATMQNLPGPLFFFFLKILYKNTIEIELLLSPGKKLDVIWLNTLRTTRTSAAS